MEETKEPGYSVRHTQQDEDFYELKLYVIGNNRRSQLAFANLKDICHKYLEGRCHIELIDLKKNPDLAKADQIIAIPTLIIKNHPERKIVGDLSNQTKVLEILDLEISNLISTVNKKASVEKDSTEELKSRLAKSRRVKDDLQPYIGSCLCRQQSQNLDRWEFSLPHSPY